jgi:hypothetical protein
MRQRLQIPLSLFSFDRAAEDDGEQRVHLRQQRVQLGNDPLLLEQRVGRTTGTLYPLKANFSQDVALADHMLNDHLDDEGITKAVRRHTKIVVDHLVKIDKLFVRGTSQ